MVFEGKGKATWRDHPSVSIRGNLIRSVPGLGWAIVAFGIYVAYDQFYKKKNSHHHIAHHPEETTQSSNDHHH